MAITYEPSCAEFLRALDRKALRRLWDLLQDDSADQRDQLMHDLMRVPPSHGTELSASSSRSATRMSRPLLDSPRQPRCPGGRQVMSRSRQAIDPAR